MPYSPVQSPFRLVPREMSAQELKGFYRWFFDVMNERITGLSNIVKETPGFETWQANYSPVSLDTLGEWFSQQVDTRQRTSEELRGIQGQSAFPIEFPNWELTDVTFSFAMDIGMYFGEVLKKNHPTLQWEQPLKNKRFADYGYPVLVGFGNVSLNPVRIAIVLAEGIANKRQTGRRLRELYNIWSERVQPIS